MGCFSILHTFFTFEAYDGIQKEIVMTTKNKWLIGIGVVVGLIVLFALPFLWHALFPAQGYGMWGGMHMRGGMGSGFFPIFGGMGFGMFFMWLIPIGLLTLIGLGIAALIKYLNTPSAK
jgi:hypothetical protein